MSFGQQRHPEFPINPVQALRATHDVSKRRIVSGADLTFVIKNADHLTIETFTLAGTENCATQLGQ
jgi:hypothetical protein